MRRLGGVFTSRLVDLCTEDGTKMNFLSFLGLVDTPHTSNLMRGKSLVLKRKGKSIFAPQI